MPESNACYPEMVDNPVHLGATMSISIKLTRRTFLIIDLCGLHASLRGREVAWTPEFGWVLG